jgi:LmbE family N-acetylglucosaminyl deacetylase
LDDHGEAPTISSEAESGPHRGRPSSSGGADSAATILISPHADDIAYSLGGAILVEFFRRPLLMVTPFTRSISAQFFDGAHDVETISRLRGAEELAFCDCVGCRLIGLGLPEASLSSESGRYYHPLVHLASLTCGWPAPKDRLARRAYGVAGLTPRSARSFLLQKVARVDPLYAALRAEILSILSSHPDAVLVSPLGLGNHPNHVILSRVCRSLKGSAAKLYFYEDLPYASSYSPRTIERYVRLFDGRLRPISLDIGAVMDRKVRNLFLYRSQVNSRNAERVLRHARALSTDGGLRERMWTYEP